MHSPPFEPTRWRVNDSNIFPLHTALFDQMVEFSTSYTSTRVELLPTNMNGGGGVVVLKISRSIARIFKLTLKTLTFFSCGGGGWGGGGGLGVGAGGLMMRINTM